MKSHINKFTARGLSGLSRYLVPIVVLLSCPVTSTISIAQTNDQAVKREYFVRQGIDEALLIRLNSYEAEIESSIFGPEGKLLLTSELPRSRIAPLFQYVGSSSKPRQLDIKLSSSRNTANSQYDIEITRLAVWDNRSAALERAYQLLSFGTQQRNVNNAADWTVSINSLMSAAGTFDQYGMKELRLWSTYLAAHLIQYRLHDYNLVLGITAEILNETRASHWKDIELATQQLRSAALIGLSSQGKLQTSGTNPDPVQASLFKTASLASSAGYLFEQAQAVNLSGLDYVNRSLFPKALEQFQLALEIADSIGDTGLAKIIRESIAEIHAGQGNDPATSKVLQEIETQLAEDGGGDELALNLLQQGRIFIRSYRYPQAIEVLLQALEFENDSSIRSQVNLELAKAYFETGQSAQMTEYLEAAGISPGQVQSYFRPSYKAAISDPNNLRHSMEARFLEARSLAKKGQGMEARDVLEQLIDQVLFLRQSLPGALGAWYWERIEDLVEDYLKLPGTDAADSLLTLSKVRYSSKSPGSTVITEALRNLLAQRESARTGEDIDRIDFEIRQEMTGLRTLFNKEFEFLSKTGIRQYLGKLSKNEAVLSYHLSESAAYVWLAHNGKVRQQKLAAPRSLYLDMKKAATSSQNLSGAAFESQMAGLGQKMLGPVADLLPETVYVIPSGLLLGFPFDALRINGRYLLERHSVVKLLSFPSKLQPATALTLTKPAQIFLAGDPQDFYGGYASRIESSEEIRKVTDIFVGPGLHIIQGAALLPDEFRSDDFQQANLIHLSMPGMIDLEYANHSSLQLSEPIRGLGRTMLRPGDFKPLQLKARLVYLSATQTEGTPVSDVSQQLAMVSDLLNAGADSVIARLRSTPGRSDENLLADFYQQLESTGNIATALTGAKRQFLLERGNDGLNDWIALQVFLD